MKTKTLSPFLLGIFVLLCGGNLFGQTLLVAAASSMKDVLEEAAVEFERQSGYKVHFSFGSSGLLAHEIEGGVPYDIYIAAGGNFIQELYHRKLLVPGTSKMVCRGRLVIVVRKDSAQKIGRLRDVVNFPLIAIANPQHAPYGRAAQEALQNAGLWLGLQNRILYTERVADVLELVETGKAPIGIGAQSLKAKAHLEYIPVEEKLYTPPEAHIAIVKGAGHKEAVKAFINFLVSDKGKAILKGYGFLVP
jgi:molybdate transport system substrate-binding protein